MTDTAYLTTTLAAIRQHSPCEDGWARLLKHLGKTKIDDEPLALVTVLDSNGLQDALWCLRAVDSHDREMRLFAVWCARQVQHLMKDPRSIAALDVAERYAAGLATSAELAAAWNAARDAADSASAEDVPRATAWAAAWTVARDSARDTPWSATRASARATAWAAAASAEDVLRATAENAAWAAAWAATTLEFRRRFGCAS